MQLGNTARRGTLLPIIPTKRGRANEAAGRDGVAYRHAKRAGVSHVNKYVQPYKREAYYVNTTISHL